jgi:type IV pilus assembly protein PilB
MNLNGLARSLAQAGLIEAEKAQQAMEIAKNEKASFITVAIAKGYADPLKVATFASTEFGLPILDLAAFDTELLAKDIVSNELVEKHRILPLLKRGNRLFIAQSDPSNITAIDEIKFNTGMNVEPVLVEENKLAALVEKFLSSEESNFDDFDDEDLDVDIENPEDAQKNDEPGTGDDAPIVRFVNKMLLDAIKAGSSDVHF